MTVQRFRRKPDTTTDRDDQVAVKYTPGMDLAEVRFVARQCDASAEAAEVTFRSGPVLIVRYLYRPDDHPAQVRYETVEAGRWLAYSPGLDFLYDTDDAAWRQFYDEVTEP